MTLLTGANQVLRGLVPQVLESAGMADQAEAMRSTQPVTCPSSAARAAVVLRLLQTSVVVPELRDALFWAEAAAWAAVRRDGRAMQEALARMASAVSRGTARPAVH